MDRKKILLVDDEEAFTMMVKLNLEKSGKYQVTIENKGGAAIETAKALKPDLILLDIVMPDEDGSDIGAKINDDPSLKDIPVVFLTAIVRKQELERNCSVIGGHPFIAKPVNLRDLMSCIEKNIK